jgi:uncharacterized protein (TIGR00251 family)
MLLVSPRARQEGPAGLHAGRLRLRLKAPPVDGKANLRLIEWLAAEFGVPARAVLLLHGKQGRAKSVRIDSPARLPAWFRSLAAAAGNRGAAKAAGAGKIPAPGGSAILGPQGSRTRAPRP